MIKSIIITILVLGIISCGKQSDSKFKIDSYMLDTKYDTLSGSLYIKADIKINMIESKDNIKLLFSNSSYIKKIQFVCDKEVFPASYKFFRDSIFIDIPRELKHIKNYNLYFEYKFVPNRLQSESNNILLLYRSHNWCPANDYDVSKYTIRIETPLNLEAYSSGNFIDSSSDNNHSYYKWENILIPDLVLIIVPKNFYSISKKIIDDKELIFYTIPRDSTVADSIINELCLTFNYCNNLLGVYRNSSIRLFEFPDYDLLGFAGAIEAGINFTSNISYYMSMPNYGVSWISHEVIHQWCGGGFYFKSDSKLERFMNESLTEYIRYMYIEDEYGSDSLNTVISETKEKMTKKIKSKEYTPLVKAGYSSSVQYIKGPLVFHYVRKQIGRENFINFVKTLYNKYYLKQIDYNIFKSELSKYDPTGKVIKRMEEMTEMKGMIPEK